MALARIRHFPQAKVAALALVLLCGTAHGGVTLLGVQYQQDNPYEQYNCWYHYGNYPTSCGTVVRGCNVHVFLKNTGGASVTINDVTLAGYSLKTVLKRNTNYYGANSIYFYWDDPPLDILNAGEPVWYRPDPNPIPPSGVSRVVVRLRSVPVTQPVSIGIVTTAGTINTTVPVNADDPVLASVGFSSDRTKVYLHWRRNGGAAPAYVYMDGVDVTANATTVGDATVNFASTVLQFATPLTNMSFHVYQGVYSDGKTATGALRTWVNRFIYGTWGAKSLPDNDFAGARAWIDDCHNRGVNALIVTNGSDGLADYMGTSEGKAYMESKDYGYVKDNSWGTNPRMWFIEDEPDIEEGNIPCGTGLKIPCGGGHVTGVLGLFFLEYGETLRALNTSVPTTINLDGNFKPDGWYAYGQLADVMMVDSYYEQEMANNHWYYPQRDPLYTKPTSIYATAIATTTAAEPNPMHMILYSCEYKDTNLGYVWPFATPASKRVQAYYALAGGAKGMAYWWFKKGYPFNGLDANTTAARALWKEIGLIGDEIRTLQPQLVTSHPVTMPLSPGTGVWARTLASGVDTIILIAVNDNIFMDTNGGCQYTPVTNAIVTATLPAWMRSPTLNAFEVAAAGLSDVGLQTIGNQTQVNLGTLNVTKLVVLTTNPQLRAAVQQRYEEMVWPGVCAFAPEHCLPQQHPPSIVQHPSNQTVDPGGSAGFSVVAAGSSPLSYQWQKNQVNLSDGGHYSGCTTATLTVTSADGNDVASYRCVVSNPYGTATSNAAALTLAAPGPPVITQQPSNRSVVPGGTAVFTVAASGTTPLSYQWQKNRANLSNGGHYSGCTTATLTVSLADETDEGNYRCVVTNGYGGATSDEAVLTVTPCFVPVLVNGGFEGGSVNGVADGWTPYTRPEVPSTVNYTIQTASPAEGVQYQQVQTSYVASGGAGVYQVVTGCVSGATYTVSGWFRTNSAYGRATVKCAPDGSTSYSSAIDLAPAASTTSTTWVAFSGTVTATASAMTLFLDGQTHVSGSTAKAAAFDGLTVTGCAVPSAPSITQHPAAQSVCPGGTATFGVVAAGDGPLLYRWQKNGADVSDGGHYSGAATATLTVSGADGTDVASYRCVVSNAGGGATSGAAGLTLKAPTQIEEHPLAQEVGTGGTAVFTVTATGEGVLGYRWQKNGVDLVDGGHYGGTGTATLTITSVAEADGGGYRCVVTAGCGSATSEEATLTVVGAAYAVADIDRDGDVDLSDFAWFQVCFNGPNRTAVLGGDCDPLDFDTDGDVDLNDFAVFQACFNGPNRPPACP